jgi:formylmethanofuran dehydrogenase subunit E
MIEKYSSTVTEIAELGGATNAATSSTVVCDRCGFAYPKDKLTIIDNLELCEQCIDEED